jgi:para-aminobenzoate synthetase/4-amino-4-deoxychorismate lyase
MIVDLVRNDLGRISEFGSVQARDVFKLESYRTVHQMTSTIESTLREGSTLLDLFRSVFPCGSVTGAPKIASTGFITDLERAPRGVYCGAVGYVEPGGDCVFNVPIRTVVVDREQGEAEYGVGGGITWDSSPGEEYAEVLAKAQILRAEWPDFSLLETFRSDRSTDGPSPVRLAAHLERMESSAAYFGFRFDASEVETAIERALAETQNTTDSWRIRALSDEQGRVSVEASPCDPPGSAARPPRPTGFAARPVSSDDPFLFHKTTHRAVYESRAAENPDLFDVLLLNEDGYVTEFTRGNLVVEIEGSEWTPPRECGLLAGIFRGELLAEGRIQERPLTPAQVRTASRLWFINSLREWVEVRLVE